MMEGISTEKCVACGKFFMVGERARKNRWGLFHTYRRVELPQDAIVLASMDEVARTIRKEIRNLFPGTKFYVRVDKYMLDGDYLSIYSVPKSTPIRNLSSLAQKSCWPN